MLQKKVNEFFENNPEATEVHSALGKLFTDKEAAQKFLGGVQGHTVATHTRPAIIETEEPTKEPEPINNTGDSGTTDQQSNDNPGQTGGTEAPSSSPNGGEEVTASLPDTKNETDQNTDPGTVSTDSMTDEHKAKIDAKANEVYELTESVQKLTADKAHHATIKSAQKKLDQAKAELAELTSGKAATA